MHAGHLPALSPAKVGSLEAERPPRSSSVAVINYAFAMKEGGRGDSRLMGRESLEQSCVYM